MSGPSLLTESELSAQRELLISLLQTALDENELILSIETLAGDEWVVRMSGTDKDFVVVLLALRQRTLGFLSYFMPAPAQNREIVYQSVLRQNHAMRGICFSVGEDDAIYLKGEVGSAGLNEDTIDQILGNVFAVTERTFQSMIRSGFTP